jgi:hypothetical protein
MDPRWVKPAPHLPAKSWLVSIIIGGKDPFASKKMRLEEIDLI